MERIVTAAMYHAWALKRQLRSHVTMHPLYSPHRHAVGRVAVKGVRSVQQRSPLSQPESGRIVELW